MATFNWKDGDDNKRRAPPTPHLAPDPDRFKKTDEEVGWLVEVPGDRGKWRPFFGPTLSETEARANCPPQGRLKSSVELAKQARIAHKR